MNILVTRLLALLALNQLYFADDDLLGGLEQAVQVETRRALQDVSHAEPIDPSELKPEHVTQAIINAQSLKILQLEYKVQLLDEAHKLAPAQRAKFREQQMATQSFRNEIAHRMIERYTSSNKISIHQNDLNNPKETLNSNALKIYEKLTTETEKKEFKSNWKAAMVDPGARTSFTAMIAMTNLYGHDHDLVKSAHTSLSKYRQSFETTHSEYSGSIPSDERGDMLYRVLKNSKMIFNQSLQTKLNRIDLMESRLLYSSLDIKSKKLAIRKIELEKDTLLGVMRKNGLNLVEKDEDLSLEEFENTVNDWFEKHALKPEILVWPFDEKGEVVSRIILPDRPYCHLKTLGNHTVRAPADATVIQKSNTRIMLMTAQNWIVFDGDFELEKSLESKALIRQSLATINDPYEIRVTVQNTAGKKTYFDICNLR